MKFSTRRMIIFAVMILAIGNSTLAQTEATEFDIILLETVEEIEAETKTVTISGSVGLAGVEMTGLPGPVVTDSRGNYSVVVSYGFTGTVVPRKEGYTFRPASMTYKDVTSDRNQQNYLPELETFTISGNIGIAGVEMRGLPGNPVTDPKGNYSVEVEYGWSGKVTPIKEGYIFEPPSRTYENITSDITSYRDNQRFQATATTFTISGNVGLSGVVMRGLPGNPVTDEQGNYSCRVAYGWSGTVAPTKEGYTFMPPSLTYHNVILDEHDGNYTPALMTFTIAGEAAMPGVLLKGLPGDPITGRDGTYSAEVDYGWSGTVTPVKEGYAFQPSQRTYKPLRSNQINADYWPEQAKTGTSLTSTIGRKAVVIPASQAEAGDFDATIEDMRVMLHILDEKLINMPSSIRGILTDYGDIFGRENQASRAVYIQGYGVLFLMEVNFPLIFSPYSQKEPAQQVNEGTDPVWQRAREQVFSPSDNTSSRSGSQMQTIQARVERLQNDLIEAMQYASNIRQIDPNEWIIFNVSSIASISGTNSIYGGYGGTTGMYGGTTGMYGGTTGMYGGTTGMYGGTTSYGTGTISRISYSEVLTIRAKKADVDAFAKNEMDLEQFQQKITVLAY